MKYILVNKKIVEEPDLIKWAKWFEGKDNIVKQEKVKGKTISTIFLGVDYNFYGKNKPILFETMIFGIDEEYQERCCTWEQAEKMHEKAKKYLEDLK